MKCLNGDRIRLLLVGSIAVIVLGGIDLVCGATITVGPGGAHDVATIQAGIDAAAEGDTVLVAPGEYVITEPITFRGKAIAVRSEVGRDETAIRMSTPADPKSASVVVFKNNETTASVLEGFTITGGGGSWLNPDATGDGGGIAFHASSGTLRNCTVVQNQAEYCAGGVLCWDNSMTIITNCIITENRAGEAGGAVFCGTNSSMTMDNCVITGNSTAIIGGGLICWDDSLATLTGCTIVENSADVAGGGVFGGPNSSITMIHCTIMGNTTQDGGGVYCRSGSEGMLTNCIVAGNTATRAGGGIALANQGTFAFFGNCIIWGNTAGEWGGGIGCFKEASMIVTNSIIGANASPSGREIFLAESPTTSSVTYSNVAGGQAGVNVQVASNLDWGAGNIDADPLFADPNNGDFHLKSEAGRWDPNSQTWIQDDETSPCIDAGDPMSPISWELFPNGGFVNMGAYGGTLKASKTYFGEPVCETIYAGDINGDGQINRADLEIMALHWTDEEPLPLP